MTRLRRSFNVRLARFNETVDLAAISVNGTIEIEGNAAAGDWHVLLLGRDGCRFPLGVMVVDSEQRMRKKPAGVASEIQMDASAVVRLQTVLRRGHEHARIRIRTDEDGSASTNIWGTTKALDAAPAAPFFMTVLESPLAKDTDRTYIMYVELTGIAFRFETKLHDCEGTIAAWDLPQKVWRQVLRTAPRIALNWDLVVSTPESSESATFNASLIDLSPLGCGFVAPENCVQLWDEIELLLRPTDRDEIRVPAVVVELAQKGRVGCVFASGFPGAKQAFFDLLACYVGDLRLHQRADDAWDCLEKNGYVDLLEDGRMRSAQDDCLTAWQETDTRPESFHPVAYIDGRAIGTIAAVQIASHHWVPHSLATKVDRDFLSVTEVLYQSWPLYILAQGLPAWFSTWYDMDKPWHNRFYQVFIDEHRHEQQCFSFERLWYLCPNLPDTIPADGEIEIRFLDRERDQELVDAWQDRYDHRDIPLLRLRDERFFVFETWHGVVLWEGRPVALFPSTTSDLEMNPVGILNVVHLNIFDGAVRNEPAMRRIVAQVGAFLRKKGLRRISMSLDCDCGYDFRAEGFLKFGNARCLVAESSCLAALISNNALCFADMTARHRGSEMLHSSP